MHATQLEKIMDSVSSWNLADFVQCGKVVQGTADTSEVDASMLEISDQLSSLMPRDVEKLAHMAMDRALGVKPEPEPETEPEPEPEPEPKLPPPPYQSLSVSCSSPCLELTALVAWLVSTEITRSLAAYEVPRLPRTRAVESYLTKQMGLSPRYQYVHKGMLRVVWGGSAQTVVLVSLGDSRGPEVWEHSDNVIRERAGVSA